jgi:hypothetical protein
MLKIIVNLLDIVRLVLSRFVGFTGKNPLNMKKFEEGIFSDLRRLQAPADCVLEATRSDFLVFLFNLDCVRSKKKQKVFFWKSFIRYANSLLCDAVERELARKVMAHAVGMSVEDFVKSGIIPTGSSANTAEMARWSLSFDWTQAALEHQRQLRSGAYLNVDQIHVIRNDIASLFNRYLRPLLNYRHEHFADIQLSTKAEDALQSRISQGRIVSRPSLLAESTSGALADEESGGERPSPSRQPSVGGRKRGPRGTATAAAAATTTTGTTRSPLPSSAGKPPLMPRIRRAIGSGRQAAAAASAAIAAKARGGEDESGVSGGEFGGGAGEDEEDTFSLSTISSNEEEVRALISPRIRVAPIPTDYAANTQSYPPYDRGTYLAMLASQQQHQHPAQPSPHQHPQQQRPCPTCYRFPSLPPGGDFYSSEDDPRRFPANEPLPPTPELTPMMTAKRELPPPPPPPVAASEYGMMMKRGKYELQEKEEEKNTFEGGNNNGGQNVVEAAQLLLDLGRV